MMRTAAVILMCGGCALAQKVDLSPLDKLRDKAEESANVDLDKDKLSFASSMLSSSKHEQKVAKDFMSSLVGVYVRHYEFSSRGVYSSADLDAIRKQVKSAPWSRIVDVKDKDESVEVYVHNPGKPDQGMLIIAAEADELSVVNIVGTSDFSKLGIAMPNIINLDKLTGAGQKPDTKKDDE